MTKAKIEAELRDSVQRYGKQIYNEKEQIQLLYSILEDAKNKLEKESEIYKLIAIYQSKLTDKEKLKEAIEIVNKFIIELEAKDSKGITVNYLKNKGLYRILYRNPQIKGEELPPDDILHKLLRNGFIGIAASALIILLFSTTLFFAVPFWLTAISTGLFVGAFSYLSGILYGVVNDLFATNANLPYFLLGHQPQQTSLLRTNDKVAQGIAWGVAATFGPVVIAALLFTVTTTITAFFVPIATFLLPAMMVAMPLIAVGAEFYARKKAREYCSKFEPVISINPDLIRKGSNEYQSNGLKYMCPTASELAAWYANSDRNMFGFTTMPLIGLAALAGLIILSAVSMFLPPLLFASPIIAAAIPAAFAAAACIALIAAGVYMHVNRNKQVDDRYRLEFSRTEIESHLYLDEDMTYIRRLIETYIKPQQPNIESTQPVNNSNCCHNAFFDNTTTTNTNNTGTSDDSRQFEDQEATSHCSH